MASTLIISYDLSNPGQNYEEIIKKIKSYTSWARLGGSAYLIYTDDGVKEVRDALWSLMDAGDKVYVSVAPPPAAWAGMPKDVSNWIHKYQTK